MSGLFGGGDPEVNYTPTEVTDDKKKTKKLRTALYKTEGGAAGQEVMAGGVKRTDNIFGN